MEKRLRIATTVGAVSALLVLGCSDHQPGATEPRQPAAPAFRAIVSQPVRAPSASPGAPPSHQASRAASGRDSVAYVSLSPGTIAHGASIVIWNLATGFTRTDPLVQGGLDPAAVPAAVGDTLRLMTTDSAGVTTTLLVTVPGKRPPIVVRTDPPSKKTDVPLNAVMLGVFSEPVDSSTISSGTIKLLRNGQPVSGLVNLEAGGLRTTFHPAALLAVQTEYTLEITTGVADLSGDRLEQPVEVTFTTSGPGRIAFVGPGPDIYVIAPDGTGLTRLTNGPGRNGGPSWSPDGSRIAFVSSRDGNSNIYVMNADGTGVVRLTYDQATDGAPTWSPDGTRLAFERCCDSLSLGSQIFVMSSQGTGVVQLTTDAGFHEVPAWSPDGSKIAFQRYTGYAAGQEFPDIYVINVDGTGLTNLTNNPSHDMYPAWSPDGRKIAFASGRSGGMQIYVMNADGTGLVNLTNDSTAVVFSPTWSPDGSQIAFMGHQNGNEEIFVMHADGSGVVNVTPGEGPTWGPR